VSGEPPSADCISRTGAVQLTGTRGEGGGRRLEGVTADIVKTDKVINMQKRDFNKERTALKAENKKLKALLKNAVLLLHHSREILQHTEKLGVKKPRATRRKKTPRRRDRT